MTILPSPPPEWKRPGTPTLGIQVKVLLRMLGLTSVHWDHRPPLSDRPFDTEKWDTIPPAQDPDHIDAITDVAHDKLTNGPGGEKRITSLGSDAHNRKKRRHLSADQTAHRAKMHAKVLGQVLDGTIEVPPRKSRMPSRSFDQGKRPLRSQSTFQRRSK